MKPYNQSLSALEQQFSTNLVTGLSSAQIESLLRTYGPNELPKKPQESWVVVFLRQFQSPLIYLLLIAAAIMLVMDPSRLDSFIIAGVLIFNAIIGTVQEGRTRSMLESLQRYITTTTMVVRDGKELFLDDVQLVPGDIVLISEGARVPADVRMIRGQTIGVDESILTGESETVYKNTTTLSGENLPVYEQKNMLFKGTYVTSGNGMGLVVATGTTTQVGAISVSMEDIDTQMPIKKEIDRLAHFVLLLIVGICVFLFGIGLLTGKPITELLITLTALFICVVPEGLPVILTLVLVTGAYRMAQQRVLIKRMQAIEALGRADIIMIDKTGTLTRNEMMVSRMVVGDSLLEVSGVGYFPQGSVMHNGHTAVTDSSALRLMAEGAYLLNRSEISYDAATKLFQIKGDPTEAAMAICAKKILPTVEAETKNYQQLFEIPFDSQRKYHACFYKLPTGQVVAYILGAPEVMHALCVPSATINNAFSQHLLADGLRLVAFAYKVIADTSNAIVTSADLAWYAAQLQGSTFGGYFGISDAMRPEVPAVIKQAREAGVQIVMATGDHQKTAKYIAEKTGIYVSGDTLLDGSEILQLSEQQLAEKIPTTTVYSRLNPEEKLKIVQRMRAAGHVVAMTGDGVNDAPALMAADLGIAMGSIGTEVAKQAADIILLDDSFVNIINAIEQGRHIFYTLRRVIICFFATNLGEVFVVLFAMMLNMPLPITAAQILWLNLITDGFLDVALSMEPQEKNLIARRGFKSLRLIDASLIIKTFYMALPMGIGSLYIFSKYYEHDITYARTATLITMATFQVFNTWNCRSETKSMFSLGLFANRWLVVAIAGVWILQLALLNVPALQYIFNTVPLALHDWLLIMAMATSILALEEVRKMVVRWYWPE